MSVFRVEDKYVIPENDFFELRERMRAVLTSDANAGAHGGYSISSLYFDDIWDSDYRDTVSGNPHRKKHRVRIYGNSFDIIKLEVKRKSYNRINKVSCSITKDELQKLMRGETIAWADGLDNPRSLFNEAIVSRHLAPRVIISYEREAFVFGPGNTRITFDSNVRASTFIGGFGSADLVYDHPRDADYVLEVKYDEFIPDFILQTLEIDSMFQTSFSKYGLCGL